MNPGGLKIAGVVLAVALLYAYLHKTNSVLGSTTAPKRISGLPTSGRSTVPTSATAQDLTAAGGLVSAFTGFAKVFAPTPAATPGPSAPGTSTVAYGTVTPPDPFQLPPSAIADSKPPVFTPPSIMPNLQPTNDAGVASGTDNTFAANEMPGVFDGAGVSGYGIGAGTYEGNGFGLDPSTSDPFGADIPLSSVDTYPVDTASLV